MLRDIPPAESESIFKSMVIPTRPDVLTAIKTAQEADDPDFDEIARLINSDLTLSATMLKTVNSPFYQLNKRVNSVDEALKLLGLRNICNITEGVVLRQVLSGDNRQMDYFWDSANRMAMIAAALSENVHGINSAEAYTFGLFHNCGQVLMSGRFPNYMETLERGERMSRQEFIELENRRHQTSHNVVGYLLARTWYLPEDAQLAILNHHDYSLFEHGEEAEWHHICTLIAIASLAEHILKMNIKQFEHIEWRSIEPVLLNHLAFKLEEFEDIVDHIGLLL